MQLDWIFYWSFVFAVRPVLIFPTVNRRSSLIIINKQIIIILHIIRNFSTLSVKSILAWWRQFYCKLQLENFDEHKMKSSSDLNISTCFKVLLTKNSLTLWNIVTWWKYRWFWARIKNKISRKGACLWKLCENG